jgi:hypothetical protein
MMVRAATWLDRVGTGERASVFDSFASQRHVDHQEQWRVPDDP